MTSVASTENLNFHSENDIFASEVGASSDGEGVGAAVAPKNDAAELVANSSSALSPFNNLKGIEEREEYSEAVQKETLIPANPLNHHRNLSQIPADVLSITSSIRNDYEYLTTATRETGTASENRNGADAAMDSSNDLREIRDLEFQLIPFTDDPNSKFPLEEVVDRKLKDGDSFKIGRLSSKDAYKKGMPTLDAWFNSKVVSRTHAELWWTGGQLFIKDVGSSSGTFLNKTRLSPSGKESRPYPLKEGNVLQLGVDFRDKNDHFFKSVTMRVACYDQSWVQSSRKRANPAKFQAALQELLKASNPHAKQSSTGDGSATDCCICLGETAPFQALFIAPCSHCYHYKCVMNILQRSSMFQCPLCRQVANLTASVSVEDLTKPPKPKAETASILSYGTKNDIVMNRLPSVKSSGALSQETNADNLATSPTMPVDGIPRGSSASPHHRRQFSNSSNNSVIQAGNNSNTPGGPANGSSSSNINSTNKDKNKKSFSQKLSTFFNKGGKSSTGVSGSGGAPASNTTTAATTPAVARQAATISPSGSLLPIPATHTSPNNRPTSSESDQNVAAAAAGDGLSPANPDEHKALESENS